MTDKTGILYAKDLPQLWWMFIQPDRCECGQSFEQDMAQFERNERGLALICPSCDRRKQLQVKFG